MENNIVTYRVKAPSEDPINHIYAISVVTDEETPANDQTIENGGVVFLSKNGSKVEKENHIIKFSKGNDESKKMIYGIVLKANQRIERIFDDKLVEIYFDENAIEDYKNQFFRDKKNDQSTINHTDEWLKDCCFTECWIVRDNDIDTSKALGIKNAEKGDLVMGMHCSDKFYNDFVLTGRLRGFSIDSFLSFEKVEMKKEIKGSVLSQKDHKIKNKNNIMLKLTKLFGRNRSVRLSTAEVDGKSLVSEDFEIGSIVYYVDEEGVEQILADFVFELDGYKHETDAEGIIISKEEIVEETEEAIELAKTLLTGVGAWLELPVGVHTIGDSVYTVEEKVEGEGDDTYTYNEIVSIIPVGEETTLNEEEEEEKEKIKELETELAKLKARNTVLSKKIIESKTIKREKVDLSKMTAKEKHLYFKKLNNK